jgi:hypothetical protein
MAASELPRATGVHAGENPSPVAADVGSSSVYMPDARHVNPKAKMVTAAGDGIAADRVRFVADLAVLGDAMCGIEEERGSSDRSADSAQIGSASMGQNGLLVRRVVVVGGPFPKRCIV